MAEPGKIPLRDFKRRHPEIPSKLIRGWVYRGRQTGLVALGIVDIADESRCEGRFMVDEAALVRWLRVHPEPPHIETHTATGLSLRALDDRRPPDLLPCVLEAVPPGGRCISVFERDELVDWGINARTSWRITPTADHDVFELWRCTPPGSRWPKRVLLPHRLTHPPGRLGAGVWASSDDERKTDDDIANRTTSR